MNKEVSNITNIKIIYRDLFCLFALKKTTHGIILTPPHFAVLCALCIYFN